MQAVTPKGATPPFLNVRDFGAVGNGIHDDTVAINAAIAKANAVSASQFPYGTFVGQTVYFTQGNYLVTAPLTVLGSGTSLWGDPSTGLTYNLNNGQTLITGQMNPSYVGVIRGLFIQNGNGNDVLPISLLSGGGCMVDSVNFYNGTRGVSMAPFTDGVDVIRNCIFESSPLASGAKGWIVVNGGGSIIVEGNTFQGGIQANGSATDALIHVVANVTTFQILNNSYTGPGTAADINYGVYIATGTSDNYAVVNNLGFQETGITTAVHDGGSGTNKVVVQGVGFGSGGGGGGNLSGTVPTETTTYAMATTDIGVRADATAGTFVVTLPNAPAIGAQYWVKKIDSSGNPVTVMPGSGSIDGAGSQTLEAQWDSMTYSWDGSEYNIV